MFKKKMVWPETSPANIALYTVKGEEAVLNERINQL